MYTATIDQSHLFHIYLASAKVDKTDGQTKGVKSLTAVKGDEN